MSARQKKRGRVLMALSGGVDSAVSAALLQKAGYEVTGAFMINYDGPGSFGEQCWVPDYRDAVRVAAHLNIPILKLNFVAEYKAAVLDYMFDEYEAGRTPNPDVLCNTFIKFGSWLQKAQDLGFDYLATGHYAQTKTAKDGTVTLLEAADKNKDQTYFLHQLNQQQLAHALFLIGEYTKPQVRALAKKLKLPVANKEESMGICFIGEVPMEEFLKSRITSRPGPIVLSSGEVLGEHQGLPFYTIGQRHMGAKFTAASKPLYVVAKNFTTNQLVVGYDNDPLLTTREFLVQNPNWIRGQAPVLPLQCQVRLRHRQPLQKCTVVAAGTSLKINCAKAQRAVTPGQFAVFFKNGECLGGGVIH